MTVLEIFRRCRAVEQGKSVYELHLNTLRVEPTNIQADIVNTANSAKFIFQLYALIDGTFRLKINEAAPIKKRYEVEHSLVVEPVQDKYGVIVKELI